MRKSGRRSRRAARAADRRSAGGRRSRRVSGPGGGTLPGIWCSRRLRVRSSAGSIAAGRAYRGGCGLRKIARTSASSTTRPAYMTTTRSQISATTPRSWVISRIAVPSSLAGSSQQLEHLRLDRDVERRRRLVGDQQLRVAGQRHGDHHPLAHAAGELVRIGAEAALRVRDADQTAAARARARAAPRASSRWCSSSASPIWSPMRHHRVERASSAPGRSWRCRGRGSRAARRRAAAAGRRRRAARARRQMRRAAPAPGAGSTARSPTCRSRISPTMPTVSPALEVEADAVDDPEPAGPSPPNSTLRSIHLEQRARGVHWRRLRVEHVADGVADQVEGQHDAGDREAGADRSARASRTGC